MVLPGDLRLNRPSTEQQGACCQVTAVSSASRSLRGSRMVSLMRKRSNEATDTWEILNNQIFMNYYYKELRQEGRESLVIF